MFCSPTTCYPIGLEYHKFHCIKACLHRAFAFFCIIQYRKRFHPSLVSMGDANARCKQAFNQISPYMVFCLEQVDTYNLVAVGGSAPTVSPSGYVMGGGHAPITRKLGLGVDQVLEMTVVMADGSVVTISQSGESLCLSVCLSFCLSVSVSLYLSLYLSLSGDDGSVVTVSHLDKCACLSICLSACLSLFPLSFSPFVCLSVYWLRLPHSQTAIQ